MLLRSLALTTDGVQLSWYVEILAAKFSAAHDERELHNTVQMTIYDN